MNQVKNVLIMADYRTQNSGNFIASIVELAKRLHDNGGEMVYIAPYNAGGYSWTEWLRRSGVEVIYFDEKRDETAIVNELAEIVERYRIDLIHSHFGYLHRILIQNRKKLKVKILFHDHMGYSWDRGMLGQKIKQMLYAGIYRLNGIGVVSVMEKKSKGYWLNGKKHWYVPNGLSLVRYVEHSMTREESREMLGIKPDEMLCFFLGWDIMRKGVDVAFKAIDLCHSVDPTIVLGVVGFGSSPTHEQLDKLNRLTGVNPEKSYIRFFQSTEDIFSYYRAADVYLSASRAEGLPYSVLEAVSQNTPIVVSDIFETRWAWKYTKCTVFENGNAEDCAKAIQSALATRWDESNHQEIIDEYSVEKWCDRILGIYNEM